MANDFIIVAVTSLKMNFTYIKNNLRSIYYRLRKLHREYKERHMKLIMTYLVKDEEAIIEKNIRFHHAMGVDGFIVTSHNSTDRTNDILENLKKEGLVLEIIKQTDPSYKQDIWVGEMIILAKNKYKANWVINADADEFYYSKSLNLKKSILKAPSANVLWVDSTFSYPADVDDFYFVTRPFQSYEADMLGIANDEKYKKFIGSQGCTKVIHKTRNFKKISMGNHDVQMRKARKIQSADIVLYHYHVTTYARFEEKVARWLSSAHLIPIGQCSHIKRLIELYQQGKLEDEYDEQYGDDMRNFLIENGVVSHDPSVLNFMLYKGIL